MKDSIKKFIEYPHLLGNFLGYDKLTYIHSIWIKKAWLNNNDFILLAHRNSFKTSAVIIIGYIWYSLIYPDDPVLLIREEATNARSALRKISSLLQTDKMRYIYREVYEIKDFKLVRDNADSIILPTKKSVAIEGSLDAVGIGTSIVGRHYKKLMLDDVITINDRMSSAKREKKKLFVQELENIKMAGGSMTLTDTPWHNDDALIMLENKGVLVARYPIYSIKIDGFDNDKIEKLRSRMTKSLFAANYELKHVADEDKPFGEPKFFEWEPAIPCYALCDPAYSGTNTTALTILQYYLGKITARGWIWREDIIDNYDKITEKLIEYKPKEFWIENNADKGASEREFKKRYYNVRGYHESQNKLMRILDNGKKNWPEIHFANDVNMEYLNQICDWSENEDVDDAIDSLASCIKYTGNHRSTGDEPIVITGEMIDDFLD